MSTPVCTDTAALSATILASNGLSHLGQLPFTKMHGLGNDFVMIAAPEVPNLKPMDLPELTRILCDRHFGVGADGLIVAAVSKHPEQFDLKFVYYNGNGEEAEMCGNGIRCFARFAYDKALTQKRQMRVDTRAGLIVPTLHEDGQVTVDMGPPVLDDARIPFNPNAAFSGVTGLQNITARVVQAQQTEITLWPVSMGNPHAIIFQEDQPNPLSPEVYGPLLEVHPAFPARTNVEFVEKTGDNQLKVTVWERGCGFTLACGTGACATVVAALLSGKVTPSTETAAQPVEVVLPGGSLWIEWSITPELKQSVLMTGPAAAVFSGTVCF